MKQLRRLVSTTSTTRSDDGSARSQPPPDTWQAFRVIAEAMITLRNDCDISAPALSGKAKAGMVQSVSG